MNLSKRVDKLEAGGERKHFIFYQDMECRELYHTTQKRNDDTPITEAEIEELAQDNEVLLVVYAEEWRGST